MSVDSVSVLNRKDVKLIRKGLWEVAAITRHRRQEDVDQIEIVWRHTRWNTADAAINKKMQKIVKCHQDDVYNDQTSYTYNIYHSIQYISDKLPSEQQPMGIKVSGKFNGKQHGN